MKKYLGIQRYGDQVFDNIYPQIISPDIFNIVKSKIEVNKYGKHKKEICYLLKNKLFCGYCGKQVISYAGTSKSGEVKRYYKCVNKMPKLNCELDVVKKELIEQQIIKSTQDAFSSKSTINAIADRIIADLTNNDNHLSIMTSLENELRKTERGIENILSAIENGVVTASTKNRLEELERRKEEVEQKIILEQTKTKLQLDRSDIVIFIQKALKQKPLLLIDLLVNKIVLYNDKIQIFYNYTDNKSPDDNHQDFLFYSNSDTIDNTWNRPNVRKRLNEYEIQAFI